MKSKIYSLGTCRQCRQCVECAREAQKITAHYLTYWPDKWRKCNSIEAIAIPTIPYHTIPSQHHWCRPMPSPPVLAVPTGIWQSLWERQNDLWPDVSAHSLRYLSMLYCTRLPTTNCTEYQSNDRFFVSFVDIVYNFKAITFSANIVLRVLRLNYRINLLFRRTMPSSAAVCAMVCRSPRWRTSFPDRSATNEKGWSVDSKLAKIENQS